MGATQVSTFCRVCEPQCGILATVDEGRITKVAPHHEHVSSMGHFCKKASGMIDVTYDPDRVIYPMKRSGGPGEFERISWEQAFSEICDKLSAVRNEHGNASVATFVGNPPVFAYATFMGAGFFAEAMDIKWKYNIAAEDSASLVAAFILLYGTAGVFPVPDLWKTDFLLIEGANPVVSHGSALAEPRMGMALKEIEKRGGRVVVVDPRRTETAHGHEYVPIRAGSDPYFLLAMIREIIEQDLCDDDFIQKHTRDFDLLKAAVQDCTVEWAEANSGVPAQTIRQLAHDFASAKSATVHCRTGTSTQRYGTLSTVLLHTLCIITGNLDRRGGLSFGWGIMDFSKVGGPGKIGEIKGRTTGMPEVGGMLPSLSLVTDIEEPGEEQVRALMMIGANPVLQSPMTGEALPRALQNLDLFVSIDLYMNETNKFADYLLPSTAMFEREDVPLLAMLNMLRPNLYATKPVISPVGEAREDWQILNEICHRLGLGGALPGKFMRTLARLGLKITPRTLMDITIRTSSVGDRFGLKPGGLSFSKLQDRHPNGVMLKEDLPVGIIGEKLMTPDKKICLFMDEVRSEIERLKADEFYRQDDYPLRMHSMREKLTHNSWMHNSARILKIHREHTVRIGPDDAAPRGIEDGDMVSIRSAYGEVTAKAKVTDVMSPGNVSLPHGWGHDGGWRHANEMGGVNSNIIASDNPADSEKIAGMSVLNGIPVQVSKTA